MSAALAPVQPAVRPRPARALVGFGPWLAFGLVQASTLAALGRCGALRLTPWRCLLLQTSGPVPALPEATPGTIEPQPASATNAPASSACTACAAAPGSAGARIAA